LAPETGSPSAASGEDHFGDAVKPRRLLLLCAGLVLLAPDSAGGWRIIRQIGRRRRLGS